VQDVPFDGSLDEFEGEAENTDDSDGDVDVGDAEEAGLPARFNSIDGALLRAE
jgi:hypothetical protein